MVLTNNIIPILMRRDPLACTDKFRSLQDCDDTDGRTHAVVVLVFYECPQHNE